MLGKLFVDVVLPHKMYWHPMTFACWQQAGKHMFWEALGWLEYFQKWPRFFSTNSAHDRVLFHTVGHFWVIKRNTWVNYTALQCDYAVNQHVTVTMTIIAGRWFFFFIFENFLQVAQTKWMVQDKLKTKESEHYEFHLNLLDLFEWIQFILPSIPCANIHSLVNT